jgi:hypothetical protein
MLEKDRVAFPHFYVGHVFGDAIDSDGDRLFWVLDG